MSALLVKERNNKNYSDNYNYCYRPNDYCISVFDSKLANPSWESIAPVSPVMLDALCFCSESSTYTSACCY